MKELITIQNLNKRYGKKQVLKDINLTLHSGRIIGLLGPNGSGKTTIIKILNGLLKDYQGQILVDGHSLGVHSKKLISYLPDEPYFENWMTTSDALNLFVDMYDDFIFDMYDEKSCPMCASGSIAVKPGSRGN